MQRATPNTDRHPAPPRARAIVCAAGVLLAGVLFSGCVAQPGRASLPATLSMVDVPGGTVAMQNGIPVPTFDPQPRPTIDLAGAWRVEPATLDPDVTLTDRRSVLGTIERDADGRQLAAFDDSAWQLTAVPGTIPGEPALGGLGAWYRTHFVVPPDWAGDAITLKFGAADYVADVWLNGRWLGYHEGGDTPFAFAVEGIAAPGADNVLAVRVDVPAWGTRMDIVPWGLVDATNHGGITQDVWLEASPALSAVRADVQPSLDGGQVIVVVQDRGHARARGMLSLEVFPASLSEATLLAPDARALVPDGARPAWSGTVDLPELGPGGMSVAHAAFRLADAARWDIGDPRLYVLHVEVHPGGGPPDDLYVSFGLRTIAVDPSGPRLLLDGTNATFAGVAVHDETVSGPPGAVARTSVVTPSDALGTMRLARSVGATLLRMGHSPAPPALLALADRLGMAVWEEIPLCHFTPVAFQATMARGIPQQMLREMALRDGNHPSVLFYGLANESAGGPVQADALARLREVGRAIDPTRLYGHAAYAFDTTDTSSAALDVAGFTFYEGVFYGSDAGAGTARTLDEIHRRMPDKPVLALEFGHWADEPDGAAAQVAIFRQTGAALESRGTNHPGGFVAGLVWWTLTDYTTSRPGIALERFGLFDPTGRARPAASEARSLFASLSTSSRSPIPAAASAPAAGERATAIVGAWGPRLALYTGYGAAVVVGMLAALFALPRRRRRIVERARAGAVAGSRGP
jgi:beta-galactosidase